MAKAQNGWPVATRDQQDEAPLIGTIKVPNGVLKGDVATVFRWLARQYDSRVEKLAAGTCWGWFVKNIEGSASISNHAAGCAVDFNADRHPMGKPASSNMSAKQIADCRAIVRESARVLRWGGDYTGRPDPMHWEIVGTPAQVATFANKIRSEEDDDMPTAAEIAQAVWDEQMQRPDGPAKPGGSPTTAAREYLRYRDVVEKQAADSAANKVIAALTPLIGKAAGVDVDQLVAKLAPAVAQQVIALLPEDRDDITPAELQAAIVGALTSLVERPSS